MSESMPEPRPRASTGGGNQPSAAGEMPVTAGEPASAATAGRSNAGDDRTAAANATGTAERLNALPSWLKGLLPLALLAGLVGIFLQFGPMGVLRGAFPPVEELTITRVTLPESNLLRLHIVNGGPEPVTIAQILVNDAVWTHTMEGGERTVARLDRRTITIPYPWVAGEPLDVTLLTSTGLTFSATVDVATPTPSTADPSYIVSFALLGLYVGVIPVFLGLLWLPFLRGVQRHWTRFFLALTAGLLVFLGVDTLAEAIGSADRLASAFQGIGLVALGVIGTFVLLTALGRPSGGSGGRTPVRIAVLIALGIGLHNLGEGLAIGASYATGEIALGAFLVIGFLLHNSTEGLGIVAPLARSRPTFTQLAGLGLIAGLPTVFGAWLGGLAYSPLWSTLFFAIGAGAIAQVVRELWAFLSGDDDVRALADPWVATGLVAGLAIMYGTGIFVGA